MQVSESQYGLNRPKHTCVAGAAPKDSKEERHRKWLFDNLEGLSADDLARLDLERNQDVQQSRFLGGVQMHSTRIKMLQSWKKKSRWKTKSKWLTKMGHPTGTRK
jgi:hypothetical protein